MDWTPNDCNYMDPSKNVDDKDDEIWNSAEEHDSHRQDDSNINLKNLPRIQSFAIRMCEPVLVLVWVLRAADVRCLDVMGFLMRRRE